MEQLQRPKPVDGYAARGAGPEAVVEDLERPITVVANPVNRLGELGERKVALSRHVAEVAAPAKVVHREARRVGDLHEEQLFDSYVADARARNLSRKRMETVEDQADRRMVDVANQAPRIAVVERVAAPSERLVAHAHMPFRRALAELR
jgi:hypothetical protein